MLPDTNPDAVKLLSDEDVAERFNYVGDDARMVAESDGEFVRYSDYDALCATVRALREREAGYARVLHDRLREMEALGELVVCEANSDPDSDCQPCGICNTCLKESNTALREQLVQARTENERLASQLKEWQEEKDAKAGYL